jgi:hypothetical protein
MALALGTRELFIYYLPGFIIVIAGAIWFKLAPQPRAMWSLVIFFVLTTLAVHLPSIADYKR